MKTNQLLGVAGGVTMAVGTFLPILSYMGQSFTLWNFPLVPQTAVAVVFIALGVIGLLTALKGGKVMNIITLVCGILGAGLVLQKTQFSFGMFGTGAWLMLLGGILLIASGAMGMKKS